MRRVGVTSVVRPQDRRAVEAAIIFPGGLDLLVPRKLPQLRVDQPDRITIIIEELFEEFMGPAAVLEEGLPVFAPVAEAAADIDPYMGLVGAAAIVLCSLGVLLRGPGEEALGDSLLEKPVRKNEKFV